MGFTGLTALGKLATRFKYGKQIGNMNKNMQVVFEKATKDGKKFTLYNAKTGNVEQTKIFRNIGDANYTVNTFGANGDHLSEATIIRERLYSSLNSQAYSKVRTVHSEYNQLGVETMHRDATLSLNQHESKPATCDIYKCVGYNKEQQHTQVLYDQANCKVLNSVEYTG